MKTKFLIPSILIIFTLVLAACGSDSEETSRQNSVSALTAAINNSERADTFKIDGTLSAQGTMNGEELTYEMKFEGRSTFDGTKSSMRVDMTQLFEEFYDGDFFIETRVIDGNVYSKTPNFMTGEEEWTKNSYQSYLEEDESLLDPSDFLSQLRSVSGNVENLGSEEINGESTTRYQTTISKEDVEKFIETPDAKKIYENLGLNKETYKSKLLETYEDDVDVNIWINEDGYISRLQMETTSTQGIVPQGEESEPSNTQVDIKIVLNFSEWGEDFDVEIPDLNETGETVGTLNLESQIPEELRNNIDLEGIQSRLNEIEM